MSWEGRAADRRFAQQVAHVGPPEELHPEQVRAKVEKSFSAFEEPHRGHVTLSSGERTSSSNFSLHVVHSYSKIGMVGHSFCSLPRAPRAGSLSRPSLLSAPYRSPIPHRLFSQVGTPKLGRTNFMTTNQRAKKSIIPTTSFIVT